MLIVEEPVVLVAEGPAVLVVEGPAVLIVEGHAVLVAEGHAGLVAEGHAGWMGCTTALAERVAGPWGEWRWVWSCGSVLWVRLEHTPKGA